MSTNTVKVGLFGYGCVGQGFHEILKLTKGLRAEIVKICVKNPEKVRNLPAGLLTYRAEDVLEDPSIDVVVELVDDSEAAYHIVTAALKAGKAVVSANKKLLAEHFEELYQLQQVCRRPLLYEASCCAGIPIIRSLEEYYDNDLLDKVEGIFNGSSNYILTKVFGQGLSFAHALEQAQAKGFAESDPSLDIEGFDAKFKLCILLAHAFGLVVEPEQVLNLGITRVSAEDIRYAKEKGLKIKLVAIGQKFGDEVFAAVLPKFVAPDDHLFNIDAEFNGVKVESIFAENQIFLGKGAGGFPTGSAVLSDLSALTYDYKYEYKKRFQNQGLRLGVDFGLDVYLRFDDASLVRFEDFEELRESYRKGGSGHVLGRISLARLLEAEWLRHPGVNLVLLPEPRVAPLAQPAAAEAELAEELLALA